MGDELTERVHIAGFPLRVRNKARQLCAWCGFVLIENDYENMAAAPNEDGTAYDWSRGFYAMNALVAIDGPNGGVTGSWVVKEDPENPKLPSTCCAYNQPRPKGRSF